MISLFGPLRLVGTPSATRYTPSYVSAPPPQFWGAESASSSGAKLTGGAKGGASKGPAAPASAGQRVVAASAVPPSSEGSTRFNYRQIEVTTFEGVGLFDITPHINQLLDEVGATDGFVNVMSRHTTTAIVINEMEPRLLDDVRQFLPKLVPPEHPYLHNDLHLREAPEGWPGGSDAWRAQEPINAHSHLQAMLLGQTETIPVHDGRLALGTWQSVILVELDGTKGRTRTVALQYVGQH